MSIDEQLQQYDKKSYEEIVSDNTTLDMTNSGLSVEDMDNAHYESLANAVPYKRLGEYTWSYTDNEFVLHNATGMYDYALKYINSKPIQLFDKPMDFTVDVTVPYASYISYVDGHNVNYLAFYSETTPGIYVYAYVE